MTETKGDPAPAGKKEQAPSLWYRIKDVMGWHGRDELARRVIESQKKAQEKLKSEMTTNDHKEPLDALFKRLGTADVANGLSSEQVKQKHQTEGYNRITPPKKTPKWIVFMGHMTGGFSLMLWAGSLLCFIIYGIEEQSTDLSLGIVLALVVFITGCFSFYQENKSEAVLASFLKLTPTSCLVKRDGSSTFVEMNADQLCRGDIVQLRGGYKVPADTRIIESLGLKVDNSSLTGEPLPLKRIPECTHDDPFETKNMAYYGTNCTEGSAVGVVTQIGDRTAMGIIAKSTLEAPKPETLMKKEIHHFIRYILCVALTIGAVFGIGAGALGYGAVKAVVFVIGIIVANVPEGLLATVTVALTITAQNMAAKHVLVKNTETIETLGSVTVICSDKTGTLTQNRMTVRHAIYNHATNKVDHPNSSTPTGSRKNSMTFDIGKMASQAYMVMPKGTGEQADRGAMVINKVASNLGTGAIMVVPKRVSNAAIPAAAPAAPAKQHVGNHHTADLAALAGEIDLDALVLHAEGDAPAPAAAAAAAPAPMPVPDMPMPKAKAAAPAAAPVLDEDGVPQFVTEKGEVVDVEVKKMTSLDFSRPMTHPVFYGNAAHDAVAKQYAPATTTYPTEYNLLLRICALCNHANFVDKKKNILQRATNGDASESALLKFSASHIDIAKFRKENPEVACIAFNSHNKYMVTVHRQPSGRHLLLMKGAPERVLDRCARLVDGIPFDADQRREVERSNMELAANGERVLAFAQRELSATEFPPNFEFDVEKVNFPTDGLTFLGLLSLEDPPRPEVPPAVACCQQAGIQVVMVTGDHPLTAKSIAQQVGIVMPDAGVTNLSEKDVDAAGLVITGPEVDGMTDEDWKFVLSKKQVVFARTLPTQKQNIVKHFQAAGHVVAVTGDGVNDSPALKAADVGIAMGSGSDVAKDAADMVLTDDNFASIIKGVEEGRIIFDNLKKSIAYVIESNIPEIWPFLFHIIVGIPLALTTVMILCIDLGTDMWPAISFAYEKGEADIMLRKPRDQKKDRLVDYKLMLHAYVFMGQFQTIGMYIAFFWTLADFGFTMTHIFSVLNGVQWEKTTIDMGEDGVTESNCQLMDVYSGGGRYSGGEYVTTRCSTHSERTEALRVAQSAAFVAIVICQIGGGISNRTRFLRIHEHHLVKMNWMLTVGYLEMVALCFALVYIPSVNDVFGFAPMKATHWWGGFPASAALIIADEIRKVLIKRSPKGWLARASW